MIDLKVCVSCYNKNRLSRETIDSIKALAGSKYSFEIFMKESTNIEYVKNDLVNDMMGDTVLQIVDKSHKYRLMIEDGVKFSIDDIDRLMSYNYPVVAAVKKNRLSPEYYDCGFYEVEEGTTDVNRVVFFDSSRETVTVHQVDWVNSPLMLIDSSVFDFVEYPWFEQFKIELVDPKGMLHKKCVGENMGFCKKLLEAKIPLIVDMNTVVEVS